MCKHLCAKQCADRRLCFGDSRLWSHILAFNMRKFNLKRCFGFKANNRSSIKQSSDPLLLFADIKTHNWIILVMKMSPFLPSISLPSTDKYTFGSVHNLNSGETDADPPIDNRSDAGHCSWLYSWLDIRSGIPILIISIHCLRFATTVLLQILDWRYLRVMSCPSLTATLHSISLTFSVVLYFVKKCQIEEVIIVLASFLRPMPFSAKCDVRLYSVLVFLLLAFSIVVELIANSSQATQWDRHSYRTRFTHFADHWLDRHRLNPLFNYLFHIDLLVQHLLAFVLITAKVTIDGFSLPLCSCFQD